MIMIYQNVIIIESICSQKITVSPLNATKSRSFVNKPSDKAKQSNTIIPHRLHTMATLQYSNIHHTSHTRHTNGHTTPYKVK